MHEARINGEGDVTVSLSGGHAEAAVSFYKDGERPSEYFGVVKVTNHKGDLTIEIPNFDSCPGYVITARGDHQITVAEIR